MTDLRTEAVRGAGWTAAQKWVVRASGLLVFVALSRLLGPTQIGMGAVALAVTTVLSLPLQMAASSFLVRVRERDARTENTVFWSVVGVSVVAVGLVVGTAAILRAWGGPVQLSEILVALSPIVVLTAVEAVPSARLERDLQFRSLAYREMVSAIGAGVLGVALALYGAGVWALVAQALAQNALSLVLVVAFTGWRPGFSFSRRTAGELARFSGPLAGVQLTELFRDRGEAVILGALLGLEALGIWSIATRILAALEDVSIALLHIVAFPVFARIREDRARLARAYEVAITTSQALLIPVLAVLAVTAPVLVPAVFGPSFAAAVIPTQILCLRYAIVTLGYLNGPILMATGRVGVQLVYTLSTVALHLGVVALVAPYGLAPLAVAVVIDATVAVAVGAWLLATRVGLPAPLPRRSLVTLACGLAAGAIGLAVVGFGDSETLLRAAAAAALVLVVFATGLVLFNRSVLDSLRQDARRLVGRVG